MAKIPTQKVFRFAHASIVTRIDQVRQCGRSYEDARPFLLELYEMLLDYMSLQTAPVFQQLEEQNSGNRENLKMLEFLAQDITELRIEILEFYERFSHPDSLLRMRAFAMEFLKFSSRVIQRLELEEGLLFPLLPG
ncbi:MAG TPA: hypothetical protein P5160_07815 [Candidatus Omnitrophota bacterium]|nr:hypothetical protein [Candidatus Omnitrophota bacterium]